jgi:hypothetical protein
LILAACREILLVIARRELPDGPGREEEIRTLVERALPRVPAVLASLTGMSEVELHAALRRTLLDQLRPLTSRPATDLAGERGGDASTRYPGSGDTPEHSDAATPAEAPEPTTDHPEQRDSLPDASVAGVQTVPESSSAARVGAAGPTPPALTQLEGFEHITEIAVGGMGVVYRAWQTRLKRWVALKCLPPEFADDPDRLKRFRQEALLAAGLTEPGIVQVYDILEQGGSPILVLSYIDGCDLNKIISQRRQLRDGKEVTDPHPQALRGEREFVGWMLPFFDRVLDALVGLHGAGVLHRDLKPSNILVDKNGNGWLTDFGLARLANSDTATHRGQVIGTRGFMSPEQWEGDDSLDAATDVFAMGVTLCEALTLELPYGKARITAATPPADPVKLRRRPQPPNLDLVLGKAIHPDRRLRYQTAADLRDDWQRVRKGQLPRKAGVSRKRRLWHVARQKMVGAGAFGLVALVVAFQFSSKPAPVPEPASVPVVVRKVRVRTEPPGARVALVPLNPDHGTLDFDKALQTDGKTPVTLPDVPPGDYLVVVEVPGHGFHEVFRRVPEPGEKSPTLLSKRFFPHSTFPEEPDGTIDMPLIRVPKSDASEGMVLFLGGEFPMGMADPHFAPIYAPPHLRRVEPFYLDKTEVTVGQFRAVRDLPPELQGVPPPDGEAVRFVDFDLALRCAEQMGKRLPDEAEYEYAATNGGMNRFPWGDSLDKITSWPFGQVGTVAYDRAAANPAVCGLYSNVAEWTSTRYLPYPVVRWSDEMMSTHRNDWVVRGGPATVRQGNPLPPGQDHGQIWDARVREGVDRHTAAAGLGFRCARSFKPRFPQPSGKGKT